MVGLIKLPAWHILEVGMTNEELFQDLKQFITATVSQEVDGLRKELKTDIANLRTDIIRLDTKLNTIQDAIADTLTQVTEALDVTEQVHDHEQRLRRLEHQSA